MSSWGLKWEDLDLDAETLRVRRTRSQAKTGPTFRAPQNGNGRSIRLTRRTVEALKAHKAAQNAERLKLGDLWEDNGLVFCTTAGKPLGFRNVATASIKPLLKKAGLPDIRFHDLRHICATLLLSHGHHPKLVQELLGHASVAMTLDRYNHVLPGMGGRPPLQWKRPCPKVPFAAGSAPRCAATWRRRVLGSQYARSCIWGDRKALIGRTRPGCVTKATTTSGDCRYRFIVTNAAFVAANKGILAALVYSLV